MTELCDRYHALGRKNGVVVGVGAEGHGRYSACRSLGDRDAAKNCGVVFCTLATAGRADLKEILAARDLVVVDEAGQAVEPDVVSACDAAAATRLILCGDPLQLPPMVSCEDADGLRVSCLERLLDVRDANVSAGDMSHRFLDEQRRMDPLIADYPNRTYYGGRVGDAAAVVSRAPPRWLEAARRRDPALRLPTRCLVDCKGTMKKEGTSYVNLEELRVVARLVDALLPRRTGGGAFGGDDDDHSVPLGGETPDVAVIAFYAAQVRALENALEPRIRPGLRVGSVDAFQGSEADVVVISAVRAPYNWGESRPDDLGFVKDKRRFNVALTRARHALVVVCDADTLANERAADHVSGLVRDATAKGDVVPAASLDAY